MKRKATLALAAVVMATSLSGCGSILGTGYAMSHWPYLDTSPVYIGTRNDAKLLGDVCTGEAFSGGPNATLSVFLFPIVLTDLIASAIVDALFLPLTVMMEIWRPHGWQQYRQ